MLHYFHPLRPFRALCVPLILYPIRQSSPLLSFGKISSIHFYLLVTPHCNDDLNKINELRNLMINSSKLMPWLCKITILKSHHESFLRFKLACTANLPKFGRILACVVPALKNGSCCSPSHLLEFIIILLGSFVLSRSSLQ